MARENCSTRYGSARRSGTVGRRGIRVDRDVRARWWKRTSEKAMLEDMARGGHVYQGSRSNYHPMMKDCCSVGCPSRLNQRDMVTLVERVSLTISRMKVGSQFDLQSHECDAYMTAENRPLPPKRLTGSHILSDRTTRNMPRIPVAEASPRKVPRG